MKRFISIAFFLCLFISLQAQEVYTTKNIPKVHLQDKTRYVCNPADILSKEACADIDRMLYALEQQTGIETVVAVVPSIGQEDCFDFSHQLLNEWGVGKKEKKQRFGHSAGNRPTLHPVLYGIRFGRGPS